MLSIQRTPKSSVLRSPVFSEAVSRILHLQKCCRPKYVRRRMTYVTRTRTSPNHVRRQDMYIARIRTSGKYVRQQNTYVRKVRTSPEHVRRRIMYITRIRTPGKCVRQENTYVTGTRTSPISISKCVSECSISQRCSWNNGVVAQMTNGIKMFTNAA